MKQKGFTLIELLVVVAIIGTLAAIGIVAYDGYVQSTSATTAKKNCNEINKIIKMEITACNAGLISNFLNHSTTYCPLDSSLNRYTGGNSNYNQHQNVSSNAQYAIEAWKFTSDFTFKNPVRKARDINDYNAILNNAIYEKDIFVGYCQITTFGPKLLRSQLCWQTPCSDSNNRTQTTISVN